ncbi:uroporphyrinogen-III C-methyltransferase [Limnothrix redekei]|uniref:uroporphyrinogen-III C-methyltransferase n=1 Tax=Limnothrix redekei LRLZ20PSL1 TaxID=3112953 RepID=A0ABW7C553_9CYAN
MATASPNPIDPSVMNPPVALVGAGPGHGAYLTLRAAQVLRQAEVLVHDALVDRALLGWLPATCEQIDVGKRGGQPSPSQPEIDRLLVEQWRSGKRVVRLKAGDPFVFGRASSEIQALQAAGATFEMIPGLSSALAGPLLAGIPLTDAVLSRCFAVASAHEPDELHWEALAQLETLVFLMAGRSLPEITRQLIRHGRSSVTPVAVIRAAATPQQQVWTGTLESIALQTERVSLSPAVVVVGEVVRLRDFLAPWGQGFVLPQLPELLELGPAKAIAPVDHPPLVQPSIAQPSMIQPSIAQPLAGKTVLVTRSLNQAGSFTGRLQAAGAQVLEVPALEIGPPSTWEPLDRAIADLQRCHWLILTSTNGVEAFFSRLQSAGKDSRALAHCKVAVVGQKTAQCLQQFGIVPDFIPPDFIADALVSHFPESLRDRTVLFPRVETGGRDVLVKELSDQGAILWEVPAYESRCPAALTPEAIALLRAKRVDAITFASSKTVKNFLILLQRAGFEIDQVARACLASIGPQTSQTCRDLFDRVDAEAREYTLDGLAEALETWAIAQQSTP